MFHVIEDLQKVIDECGCMSDCNSIEYKQSTDESHIELGVEFTPNNSMLMAFSDLRFHFGLDEYTALKRHASYGLVNFLSHCGGIYGLFLGVTALSFVEIFYFFVIRVLSDCLGNLKKNTKVLPIN